MSSAVVAPEVVVVEERMPGGGRVPPRVPPDQGDGGPLPFRESSRQPGIDGARLGMLIFIGAETMVFAGFIAGFMVLRLKAVAWPPLFQPRLPVAVTGVNTVVLLLSAYAMSRALAAVRRGDQADLARRLLHTGLLGVTFLAVQGYEWARLLAFGLTASSGVYGGLFYLLVGAHAAHVVAALTWLAAVVVAARRGRYTADRHVGLSVLAMYWTFVVALWPVLYTLVYVA